MKCENEMNGENMRTNVKNISEVILLKPPKSSRFFSSKCTIWNSCIAFGNVRFFGIVLLFISNVLPSKIADSEKSLGTKIDPNNGSTVDIIYVDDGSIALNTSHSNLELDSQATLIHSSGKFEVCIEYRLTLYDTI